MRFLDRYYLVDDVDGRSHLKRALVQLLDKVGEEDVSISSINDKKHLVLAAARIRQTFVVVRVRVHPQFQSLVGGGLGVSRKEVVNKFRHCSSLD